MGRAGAEPGLLKETSMAPQNTKVERCYTKLKGKMGKGKAAAVCQKSTGLSLATGKPPKKKAKKSEWAKLTQR
jgi:hypothetical protein